MIFVDSSVWISFFRGSDKNIVRLLRELLDADQVALAVPVQVEILSGVNKKNQTVLKKYLSALPVHYPTTQTWKTIEIWLDHACQANRHFGFADLLIAAIAKEHFGTIWSLDGHFQQMEEVGLIKNYLF